jgi:hypothetical protein|tara:strand:+ start:969 stop:1217 length:249 start_codon:yes stop_codon:yes gene_type:complete
MNIDYNMIVAFAFAGALLQEIPLWNTILDKLGLDVKPFNCALCSTFWLTLGPFIYSTGISFIFNSIIAAVLADLINRQMNRI